MPPPGPAQGWLKTYDATQKLARQADLVWTADLPAGMIEMPVKESRRYQEIAGFGATLLTPVIGNAAECARVDERFGRAPEWKTFPGYREAYANYFVKLI